jgi:hypothetical protein
MLDNAGQHGMIVDGTYRTPGCAVRRNIRGLRRQNKWHYLE